MYRVFCLFKQYMADSKERSKEINTFLIYLCEMKHFTKKKNKHLALINQSVSLFLLFFFALSLQKEYKRDLEQEVKGRGLSGVGLEETPELLRVRKANQILNQVN